MVILILKQHKVTIHNFDVASIRQIGLSSLIILINMIFLLYLFRFWAPRSVPVIFTVLFFFSAVGSRLLMSIVLQFLQLRVNKAIRVALYGTGKAAIQVLSALRESEKHDPVCFIDNSEAMRGAIISGLRVEHFKDIERVIKRRGIREVYIAIDDASEDELGKLTEVLDSFGVRTIRTPSLIELLSQYNRDNLSSGLKLDDLLQRGRVILDDLEVSSSIDNKSIMVTGAGGSIGSELCRQLLTLSPRKLILCDNNELALYELGRSIQLTADKAKVQLVFSLGCVMNEKYMESLLCEEEVDVLFHAAAYKHVTLVENNVLEAGRNNILGTLNTAQLAGRQGVSKFVLISSDKAVRPTNIMGATKRIAELMVNCCQEQYPGTNYSAVRFGNVLGSTGSVVPLFQQQIVQGGPVTVTDPEVTRYFMTIPEAARLVIIAGHYSSGGNVFVLNMGAPVKIVELAKRMIKLMGYTHRTPEESAGEIAIEFIGLKQGEKMFEELIFDSNDLLKTPHAKIFRVKENKALNDYSDNIADKFVLALNKRDELAFLDLLFKYVEGFVWNKNP